MEHPMRKPNDLSRSLSVLDRNSTLIAVIEMSQSSWLIAGIVPGVELCVPRTPSVLIT
jgi:transposase